jgi:hypothetical protein
LRVMKRFMVLWSSFLVHNARSRGWEGDEPWLRGR